MIRFLRQWIVDTLGFSKAEANGTLIMIFVIVVVTVLPKIYFLHHFNRRNSFSADKESLKEWAAKLDSSLHEKQVLQMIKKEKSVAKATTRISKKFLFDPNTVSQEELVSLGFTSRVAANIKKYTASGGQFKVKKDLKKMYGINQDRLAELWDYISLPEELSKDQKVDKESLYERSPELSERLEVYDINATSAKQLQEIRGIGPVLSARIIAYRDRLGGFQSPDQLKEVYGLSDELLAQLGERLECSDSLTTIDINTDSIKHLSRHPYIEYHVARAIFNYRQQHVRLDSVAQIKSIKIMTDSLYQRIYPYLSIYP